MESNENHARGALSRPISGVYRIPAGAAGRSRKAARFGLGAEPPDAAIGDALGAQCNALDGAGAADTESRSVRFTRDELRGVALHTLRWGDPSRPTAILLHGGGANSHWWDEIATALANELHVVALDFRGHGDSDHPDELEVGGFHRDLAALIAHVCTSDPILIGHSMGGHVALDHASERAGVRAVVAIEVAHDMPVRERRRARLALANRRSYATREDAIRRFRFFPRAPGADESTRVRIAELSVREEPDGRFGYKFDPRWFSLPPRPRGSLSDIACPTLLIRGEDSLLLRSEGAAALVAQIPRAELVSIPGCGHNVHLERPGDVLRAIRRFLQLHALVGGPGMLGA